jgi:leucyl-tRNA synthetase
MSKRLFNVVNPDDMVAQYGADTFRMYEMFLGPIELSKPWDTKGIEGVHRFLKKLWRLFTDEEKGVLLNDDEPNLEELKILHKCIKKIDQDTGQFALNTAVSQFMITVNELSALQCHKRAVLQPLLILLSPFAPHICEELWQMSGGLNSILDAPFPNFEPAYLVEQEINYPVAINGKTRTEVLFAMDATEDEIKKVILEHEVVLKWMEGKPLRKFILVKGKMINIVV